MTIFKRNPIMHFNGSSTFLGDYQITDEALKNYNVSRELFGSTQINCTEDYSYNVKDYQYDLGDGKVGMHLIPINDYGPINDAHGNTYWASQLVDEHLRTAMNLSEDEPLYALGTFDRSSSEDEPNWFESLKHCPSQL